MAKNEAKIKFTAETGEFNKQIKTAENTLGEVRSELRLNEQQMKNTGGSTETLQKRHELLSKQLQATQSKTTALAQKVQKAADIYGENSDEVSRLRRQLLDAQTSEERIKGAIDDCNKSLEKQGKATKESGEGFTVLKGVVADLAASAIKAAISKISEFTQYLLGLPEATREVRQDLATLDTSFEKAGFSTETATETWKELYKVFGEEDRAVEAANLISKMSDNQKDLSAWVEITKGVWGSYQDSLPVEGLAEASNETAKVGTVTGVLADALNWSGEAASMFSKYMSEDVVTAEDAFNEALKECTTEQERQALITDTLTALYGDAATKYDEASGSQIAAKEATAENILVQNQLADTVEPLTTAWQGYKTELMVAVMPVVEKLTGWGLQALEWMKEHPAAVQAIAAVLGVLGAALGALAIVVGVATAAQWAMNSAILANPITWIVVAVVAAIAAVIAIVVVCVKHWDKIKAAFLNAWSKIKEAWGKAKSFFSDIWQGIKNTFANIGGWFKDKFTAAKNGALNAWSNIKAKFESIKNGIVNAFSNLKDKLTAPFTKARDIIKGIADKIKGFFKGEISMPKIKLPKFSISPSGWKIGDLLKGSIPKLSIKWHASAYDNPTILNGATIFGHQNGTLLGGGERVGGGGEMIGGVNTVSRMIQSAVDRSMRAFEIQDLATAIEDLAQRPIELNINGRQFALATASDSDSVGGLRASFRNRGLALD